jgi:hypothetical protein
MSITREYEIHMNLMADEVYTGITNSEFILNKVRTLYEGRCLNSTLVVKVIRIIQHSDIYCTKSRNDGSSDLDIRFEAEAIVYNVGNVIVGCEIKKVENTGQIICFAPHAVIRLDINRLVQALGEGSIIPVRVIESAYTFGKREITVVGEIYTHPQNTFTVYKMLRPPAGITSDTLAQFRLLLGKIDEELSLVAGISSYSYFANLFNPFGTGISGTKKTVKKTVKKGGLEGQEAEEVEEESQEIQEEKQETVRGGGKKQDLKSLTVRSLVECTLEDAEGAELPLYVMKHPSLGEGSGLVYAIPQEVITAGPGATKLLDPSSQTITFAVERYDTVLYSLLREYLNYLIMLRQHSQQWDTPERIASNRKTWDSYLKRKTRT